MLVAVPSNLFLNHTSDIQGILICFQSKRKPNMLLEFVDDVEEYGKAASKLMTKYNPLLHKPIITSNISML